MLLLPGPVDTKAQLRSGALPSDEAGKFLGPYILGDTIAWRGLRAASAAYSKREGCGDRQDEGRGASITDCKQKPQFVVQ